MMAVDQDTELARTAAGTLAGGAPGLTLLGPRHRTDRIIDLLCNQLDPALLGPVRLEPDLLTPEQLREAVHRAHSARISREPLLLVLPDAPRLSPALMQDLEMAADAAATFGGLRFLLASPEPLGPALRAAGLVALDKALDSSLVVPPDTATATATATADRAPLARPAMPSRGSRRGTGRILLASGIVVCLVLLAVLVSRGLRTASPPRDNRPVATPVVPPPTVARPSPTAIVPTTPVIPAPAPLPPVVTQRPPAPASVPPPRSGGDTPTPDAPAAVAVPRTTNLLLMAQPGDTLPGLYARVYAGATPPPFEQVRALNPVVQPGTRLIFPPPRDGWPSP